MIGAVNWLRAMPALFVLIWSTGFVVARFAMPHAAPLAFLSWRYALSLVCFGVWIAWSRAPWPREPRQWGHLALTGVLMHGAYLGGVWAAVKQGMPAGTSALIVGLQPLLTAVWLSLTLGSHGVQPRQWLGLVLGLGGLVLVVWPKVEFGEVTTANLGLALAALLAITVGTLYQKRFVKAADVRVANAIQIAAALVATLPLALLEGQPLAPHPHLLAAMAWSVLVLTLGGSSLLFMLIQRGGATQVTSLLYLVPPCTALLAWVLFGESMTAGAVLGLMLSALGVALVLRG